MESRSALAARKRAGGTRKRKRGKPRKRGRERTINRERDKDSCLGREEERVRKGLGGKETVGKNARKREGE